MYTQNPNKQFAFRNQQIANSPYHLVKDFPQQQVIRQSDYDNLYGKQIDCPQKLLKFNLMPERGDFLKNVCQYTTNDERFNMNENYDRSTYLTKVRRVQGLEFESYSKRRGDELVR